MKEKLLHLSVVAVFASLFYLNTFDNFFVWNDWTLIIENFLIKDWRNLPEIFSSAFWKPLVGEPFQVYRPLVLASFMTDMALWGLNPWGYHLVSISLHVVNSILAYFLMRFYVNPTTALMGSVLFACHPIHTGTVAYISGRAELLTSFFTLSGMLCFLQSEKYRSRVLYPISLLLFFLALLAKETALILPLLLIGADFTASVSSWRAGISRWLARHVGPLALIGLYVAFRVAYVGRTTADYGFGLSDVLVPVLLAAKSISLYLSLLVFPWNLHVVHRLELGFSVTDPQAGLSMVILAGMACGLYGAMKWGNRAVEFSLLWLSVHLVPLAYLAGSSQTFLESWYYLPSLGFFLLIACALSRLQMRSAATIHLWVALLIAVLLGGLTFDRNRDWQNDLQIALRISGAAPDNPIALRLLGQAYFRRGKIPVAEKAFQKGLSFSPYDPRIHESMGRLYSWTRSENEALESYARMLQLAPHDPYSYWRIARFYLEKRDFPQSEKYFAEAARLFPYSSEIRNDLGQVYFRQGKLEEARRELEAALRISPYSSTLRENLDKLLKRPRSA